MGNDSALLCSFRNKIETIDKLYRYERKKTKKDITSLAFLSMNVL